MPDQIDVTKQDTYNPYKISQIGWKAPSWMYNATNSFIYEDVKNKNNIMNSDIKSSNKNPYLHKKL